MTGEGMIQLVLEALQQHGGDGSEVLRMSTKTRHLYMKFFWSDPEHWTKDRSGNINPRTLAGGDDAELYRFRKAVVIDEDVAYGEIQVHGGGLDMPTPFLIGERRIRQLE